MKYSYDRKELEGKGNLTRIKVWNECLSAPIQSIWVHGNTSYTTTIRFIHSSVVLMDFNFQRMAIIICHVQWFCWVEKRTDFIPSSGMKRPYQSLSQFARQIYFSFVWAGHSPCIIQFTDLQTSWKTKALLQVEAGMSWVNVDAAKGKPGGVSVSKAHKGKLHCVNSTTHEQK